MLSYTKKIYKKEVPITSPAQLNGTLRSDVEYVLDGIIDFTGTGLNITVPAGGLSFKGHNFNVSGLRCTDNNYTLLESDIGGSGDILEKDFFIEVSGTSSKVRDLTGASGFEAIESQRINYINCTSLGEINNYRQGLEEGTGRFGGTPELTLTGAWVGGYRYAGSIARGLSNLTALFKAGAGLTFGGRFITDANVDLPATGALLDFSDSNFINDESLIIQGAYITRQGVLNSSDTGLTPNISSESVKSNWKSNSGIANTQKYIQGNCSVEVVTTISAINTYYPLEGTITVTSDDHFDSPVNGQYRLLTGNGKYSIVGDLSLVGTNGDQIDVRVTKSIDDGVTFPIEIQHIRRTVNNLSGPRDVAFVPLNFITTLSTGDRVRLEVENKTSTGDITQELDSFIIITEV